jgi:hypothetical protein
VVVIIGTLLISSPVYAIANPDDIEFGTGTTRIYNVFENVLEDGDWLILAEGYVHYVVTPTDYTADEAFVFELTDITGTTTIISVPLNEYEDRPISIYLSASQVTTLGLVSGTAYGLRITGNPAIFASPVGNTIEVFLAASDYVDQNLGADSEPPTDNELRNLCIQMALNIENNDTPVDSYLEEVQGYWYLTLGGGNIFLNGIPALNTICSVLFQSGTEVMESDSPESTGTYALTLTPGQKWGATVANGLTNLGLYLGINQALAGSVVLFILVIALAMFMYQKTESGITVLLIVSATPFLGAYLGLMPMALAFIFAIIIITLLGYFFFSRGAL